MAPTHSSCARPADGRHTGPRGIACDPGVRDSWGDRPSCSDEGTPGGRRGVEKAQTGAWQREREGTCEGPTRLTTGGRAGRVCCPGRRLALTCSGLITDTQVNATLPKMPEISSKIWLSSHSHVHLLSKPSIKIENTDFQTEPTLMGSSERRNSAERLHGASSLKQFPRSESE